MKKTLTNASPSAPLTNGLPVRKNFLIQMRREKVVARTLLISKKLKESKQRMKKKDPEEKKEVTEEEKNKEEKPEAKGVKEEVKLA